ncbi:hypothetical protein K493DRAFT_280505 [Basidiobolus meristosporus CBS 931.73]|uniref:Rap-GAP domain-containing protein n=1 Tax=Basidiobolus meristosporus CBS 931.73 TaxID=1314790 RepID=A0A1Y1YJY0_9FUNG|nr:hypothetical protein K493DRAFT_280505 [Basidiobolus meristosporus CBS 931.73]|eukprot:ORX98320.1 hypothetical protein K493DRAFT_280505 [Basidiobolus meristosporus CBS 931.73]
MKLFETRNTEFYKVTGSVSAKVTLLGIQESLLQEAEKNILWYRMHFFGQEHQNYLALQSPEGPISISTVEDTSNKKFHILIRTAQGTEFHSLDAACIHNPWYRRYLSLPPTINTILRALHYYPESAKLYLCKNPMLPNGLLEMEERQVIRSYKFGIGYLGPGQSSEEQMYSTRAEETSPEFTKFLNFLGETIRLKGWKGYRGGLDVISDNTGEESVYTSWQNHEIMFHVTSMLPYNARDAQHLERKRHIGNDIVLIIFKESDDAFQLSTISSNRNHVVCLVTPAERGYQIALACRKDVPTFQPTLPEPSIISQDAASRDFLLHILINAERASYKAPVFSTQISRTRSVLLYDLAERFI